MSKFEEIKFNLEKGFFGMGTKEPFTELDNSPEELIKIDDPKSTPCFIPAIEPLFRWKRAFSYCITGTPNTGKTQMILFLMLVKSLNDKSVWCIWMQEMEDAFKLNGLVKYHVKDIIDTIAWMLTGKCPFAGLAEFKDIPVLEGNELKQAYQFISNHFKFFHCNERTPAGIIGAFTAFYEKYNCDGFVIDPWKSVKQEIIGRSDTWLEDALMSFKEFSLETNSYMIFIVHPKSLRDYRDEDGNYRIITAFDLNGGAAWNNSMDIIISLRRMMDGNSMEWHSLKIRKQHKMGKPGSFNLIKFNEKNRRYIFNNYDAIDKKTVYNVNF